jgi:mono/diheme cytochrome c family protein
VIGQAPAASQAPTQAAAAPGNKPVSYSSDQADRGEKRYNSSCADCHGDDLKGGLIGGPPLRGVAFDQAFANGAPASGLFGFMSTQMPPDSPGQFSASGYADLMAYILKQNGYQPGAALPSDSDALDHLIIQK